MKHESHTVGPAGPSRRTFVRQGLIAAGAAMFGGVAPAFLKNAFAADFGKPEKTDLTIGFIPLTDCASEVMAGEQGFAHGHPVAARHELRASVLRFLHHRQGHPAAA